MWSIRNESISVSGCHCAVFTMLCTLLNGCSLLHSLFANKWCSCALWSMSTLFPCSTPMDHKQAHWPMDSHWYRGLYSHHTLAHFHFDLSSLQSPTASLEISQITHHWRPLGSVTEWRLCRFYLPVLIYFIDLTTQWRISLTDCLHVWLICSSVVPVLDSISHLLVQQSFTAGFRLFFLRLLTTVESDNKVYSHLDE